MSLLDAVYDVAPETTRLSGLGITPDRLGAIWPAASERLMRVLAMRGLDSSRAEDLVQDVGVKAMQSKITFDDVDDFLWWAMPVVRNLHVDLVRSSRHTVPAAEMPDRESVSPAVEHVVEHRLALQTVLKRLTELPEGEREVIVAAATDAQHDGAVRAGTVAVRRHRARAHLRRLCGGVLSVTGLAAFGRRLRSLGVSAAPVTVAAWFALPAVVLGLHIAPSGEPYRAIQVAHPTLNDAVAVTVTSPARATVARHSTVALVRRQDGPRGGGHAPTSAGTAVAAPSRVYMRPEPTHGRGVVVEEREGSAGDPLLCVHAGGRLQNRCVEQPLP